MPQDSGRSAAPPTASAEHTPAEPDSPAGGQADEQPPTIDSADEAPPPLSNPGEELPFQRWERYRIVSFIGAGGMGSVYKAIDPRLKRTVAIKFLRAGRLEQDEVRERRRLEREARAQARIEHLHICKIYDVGEVEGQPYIAMQFIAGSSLAALQQVMTRTEKVQVIQRVAEALAAAHEQGVIHRDIKPANIMVERRTDGTYWPYLLDFGLAREVDGNSQTSTGGIEGTPAYMAPEQVRGDTRLLERRTDLYGLAATLYSVLCGRPPFIGNATDILLSTLLSDPPAMRTFDPGIAADLDVIVLKCLEKEPWRRYQSAPELAAELARFLGGARIAARPPSVVRRLGKLVRRHTLLVATVTTALLATLMLGGVALRARMQAAAQARLAQQLTQEIKDMEWLLRSARQLPLHDLEHEKRIIRRRMQQLQTELGGYGALARGLGHYALGRGHLALHEYPQSLAQLQLALAAGNQSAELHHALGLVLGKHFERAIHEARLSGGGDWARKQLKDLEPKYLIPAIASLTRSRAMKLEAPEYLEAMISFYQGRYDEALAHAARVREEAPWLYEAEKLAGDVHHQRALQARDSGRYEEAETEFNAAVRSYEQGAAIGQSDAEVYEGLAETWVRRIEMQVMRSQSTDAAYAQAVRISDRILAAEPKMTTGWVKKATAAMMTMAITGSGLGSDDRVAHCLEAAHAVLKQEPDNPYAGDAAANCYETAAEQARMQGQNPEPLWEKGVNTLEPILKKNNHFLWGLSDLAIIYQARGAYLASRGRPTAKADLQTALHYLKAAGKLDDSFLLTFTGESLVAADLVMLSRTKDETIGLVGLIEENLKKCISLNNQDLQCQNNPGIFYARLAKLQLQAGDDPRHYLARAKERFARLTQLGAHLLDAEQHMALTHLVDASDRVGRQQDPAGALVELQAALGRCFALAAQDVMCQTLAAQAEWVAADWLALQHKPTLPALERALAKAVQATGLPEQHADALQALAESHVRLARATSAQPALRARHVSEGLRAAERIFAINPRHEQGRATQEALRQLALPAPAEQRIP